MVEILGNLIYSNKEQQLIKKVGLYGIFTFG